MYKDTKRKLLYIERTQGFSQRTYDKIDPSPFLPFESYGLWRSPITQASIRRDLEECVLTSKLRPENELLELAIYRTYDMFRLPDKMKMIHLNDVFQQDLDIWSKSPGLPWRDLG